MIQGEQVGKFGQSQDPKQKRGCFLQISHNQSLRMNIPCSKRCHASKCYIDNEKNGYIEYEFYIDNEKNANIGYKYKKKLTLLVIIIIYSFVQFFEY